VISPYGSRRSPITSERVVAESVDLPEVRPAGDAIYWLQERPYEVTATRDDKPETHSDVVRYEDAIADPSRRRLVCVMEDHRKAYRADGTEDVTQVVNSFAAISLDGLSDPILLASDHDFYSNPRLSPDGEHLAWLSWDHPRMPWVGTELWVADVAEDGSEERRHPRRLPPFPG
jgi:hypothetical protein